MTPENFQFDAPLRVATR